MRFTISEKNVERIRAFLKKNHSDQTGDGYWDYTIGNFARSTSPGYTMDDALDELLKEVGF